MVSFPMPYSFFTQLPIAKADFLCYNTHKDPYFPTTNEAYMIQKQNLHIHSTWCDGADTPEEMIAAAMEKGFDSIGFSGHSPMAYSPGHAMSPEGTEFYKQEIRTLQKKYAGQIEIFCGLEVDMYSEVDLTGYDYLIGSVHYFRFPDTTVGFDRSQAEVQRVIDQRFGGDGMAYARAYYESMTWLPRFGNFDIIGHFDLITKHSENCTFFDTESKAYQNLAIEAAEALAGKIPFFEVNTGAISRGYRTTPYPAPFLLKELHRLGYGAVISSDCHDRRALDCWYPEAAGLLLAHGFREIYVLTAPGRFEPVSIG